MSATPGEKFLDGKAIKASLMQPEEFRVIFDRHFDDVYRFLTFRVGADQAGDLASDTFVKAFEKRATFDTSYVSARPWLFAIAANIALQAGRNHGRRMSAYRKLSLVKRPVENDHERALDRLFATEAAQRLHAAISTLDAGQRDVVLLIAGSGLSYEEVASALDIPIGTVRSRFSRGRERLRALVSEADLSLSGETLASESSGESQ